MAPPRLVVELLLALLAPAQAQTMNRAIARMRGASAEYASVSGYVLFEQPADDALADVTVHVQILGVTPGTHGFHVHQYGDVRFTDSLASMGAHFVPNCVPPDMDVDNSGNLIESENVCAQDAKHGLPPSVERQPGDMGNIVIQADGTPDTASSRLTIGQSKMSLSDGLRSIVGRTVVVHRNRDDGSQPFGNAGMPEAYGVIGLASTAAGTTNGAVAPSVPHVTKIMCAAPAGRRRSPVGIAPHRLGGHRLGGHGRCPRALSLRALSPHGRDPLAHPSLMPPSLPPSLPSSLPPSLARFRLVSLPSRLASVSARFLPPSLTLSLPSRRVSAGALSSLQQARQWTASPPRPASSVGARSSASSSQANRGDCH